MTINNMQCDLLLKRSDVDRMKRDIKGFIDKFPARLTDKNITEYAATHRRINTGPRQGMYDPNWTPDLIEPINNMAINSPIEKSAFLKSVQKGVTTAIENGINYFIKEHPADQIYVSGTGDLLKRWVETKLDPSIDSFGNRQYVKFIGDSSNHKKTGDTVYRKSYHGCSLDMVSARSAAGLRMLTKQILWVDECDAAPKALTTGEGNFLDVVDGRVASFGHRAKRFITSTPTTADSLIYSEFLKGDRCYYMMPCPICGVYQYLEFGDDYSEYGLKYDIDESTNKMLDCYYLCKECGEHIYDYNKPGMLAEGFWEPTAVSEDEALKSYATNSLYAPLGMISWEQLAKKWHYAKEAKDSLISFTNLYMGLPYIDDGDKPSADDIYSVKSGYSQDNVPDGVLFLTAGIDVQAGSKVDKKNPPRIEMEIVGYGRQYKSWSITYKVFYGSTRDPFRGAWDKLYKYCVSNNLIFTGEYGVKYPVNMTFADSGDAGNVGAEVVYTFCKRLKNFYPSKGTRELKVKPGEKHKSDIRSSADKQRYRITKVGSDINLVLISTVHYKDTLYTRLGVKRIDGDIQNPGFCDFPNDYKEEYFRQLTSETKSLEDGSYSAHGRRNEALDCRVYSLAAADMFLDTNVELVRNRAIKKGMNPDDAKRKIGTPAILNALESAINKQIRANINSQNF